MGIRGHNGELGRPRVFKIGPRTFPATPRPFRDISKTSNFFLKKRPINGLVSGPRGFWPCLAPFAPFGPVLARAQNPISLIQPDDKEMRGKMAEEHGVVNGQEPETVRLNDDRPP